MAFVKDSLSDADVTLFVVDLFEDPWKILDYDMLKNLQNEDNQRPLIIAINKVDLLPSEENPQGKLGKEALEEKLSALEISSADTPARYRVAPGNTVACQGTDADQVISTVTANLLTRTVETPTIWSTMMEADTRLMVCNGLPDGPNMQGLFDLDADLWRESIL